MALKPKKTPVPAPSPPFIPVDLEADALAVQASDGQLAVVAKLARKLRDLLREEDRYESQLKILRDQRRQVEEVDLPEAMDSCNLSTFTTKDGISVGVESVVAGSIKKENTEAALTWLRNNGHGGLIKTNMTIALSRGQEALTARVRAQLAALGVTVEEKETVHAQTLGAWAREMVANAVEFPRDLLGIWVGRRAKVKTPLYGDPSVGTPGHGQAIPAPAKD